MKKYLLLLLVLPVLVAGVLVPSYPDHRFNVRWSGARGDGTTDDQTAIENAIAKAYAAGGGTVWFPEGVYLHSDTIHVPDSVTLAGPGELRSTDTLSTGPHLAIILAGDRSGMDGLTISTEWAGSRQGTNRSAAVLADQATNYRINNVKVYGSAMAGILNSNAHYGEITNCYVFNTLADGIHLTNLSSNINISGNQLDSTGDDCISVVGYVSQGGKPFNVSITGNTMTHGASRGVVVVGADHITVSDNVITDMVYSGLYVGSESSITSYGSVDVHGSNNIMDSTGNSSPQALASIQIYGRGDYPTENVAFIGGSALNCRYTGIQIGNTSEFVDSTTKNVKIVNMTIRGAGGNNGFGVYLSGGTDIDIMSNWIEHFASYGLTGIAGYGAGDVRIIGNTFRDVDTVETGTEDVISLWKSTYDAAYICFNSVYDINDSTERFIQLDADSIPTVWFFSNEDGGLPSLPNSLGFLPDSLSSADLYTALDDETGSGAAALAMFSKGPKFNLFAATTPTPTTRGDIPCCFPSDE